MKYIILIGLLVGSIAVNIRQARVINLYKTDYRHFDYACKDYERKSDSLNTLINSLDFGVYLVSNIQDNLSEEWSVIQTNPDRYIFSDSHSLGGGN